jgi:recombinational DNA repair protein RecT
MATQRTQTQDQKQPGAPLNLLKLQDVREALVPAQTVFKQMSRDTGLVWDTEMNFAVKTIMGDPFQKLRLCTPASIEQCMRDLSHVGLTLNPIKHHATLVPRWIEKQNVYECSLMIMYRGMVWLATQAGVHDIDVDVVYKADEFKIGRNSKGDIFEHIINTSIPRSGDNFFRGVYVSACMPSSDARKVEWVPAEDIHKMRDTSDSYLWVNPQSKAIEPRPTSPWVRWFDEMAKKGGLKRATKRWEEAVEHTTRWQRLSAAVDLDNKAYREGTTIEGTAQEILQVPLSMEQVLAVEDVVNKMYADEGNRVKFIRKICAAYGCEVLADVPQSRFNELLERVQASAAEGAKRRTKKEGKE